jgi:hypothetical protein
VLLVQVVLAAVDLAAQKFLRTVVLMELRALAVVVAVRAMVVAAAPVVLEL